jgi:putative hemolysin
LNDPSHTAFLAAFLFQGSQIAQWQVSCIALVALASSGFFALLRNALLHSVPSRVLEQIDDAAERARMQPLLERAEALATSASVFERGSQIVFIVLLVTLWNETLTLSSLGLTVLVSVPLLVFISDLLPNSLRGPNSDSILCRALPLFNQVQRPVAVLSLILEGMRRVLMRLLKIQAPSRAARHLIEDLRNLIEDSGRHGEFGESEKEIIENVVDFYNLDVADLMTPRTELEAVNVADGVQGLVKQFSESGHSRLPVFENSLDTIIGIAFAQELIGKVHARNLENMELKPLLQPVGFVPETKRVSELLNEFRKDRLKMAVVLDEYGGTAGIITLGDIVAELVGEMREELGELAPEAIQRLEDGSIKIEANTRISEVNEFLEDDLSMELPEEADYETLAGFVLSEMGRFPKAGDHFEWHRMRFSILEANDRRVLRVLLNIPKAG